MCAILGAFTNSSLSLNLKSKFKKALSMTVHRGPDSSSELFLERALLGFNRLSIVGASNGSQPFSNEDSTIFLLCNGEIYNHRELKKKLKYKHKFITKSDCEIILHLYEEDPSNFSVKLRGQFSFLIFDKNKNQLILGRDRFGINPLYYAKNESHLLVSSEIKSILALDNSISSSLDPIGLKETFFLYGPTPPRTCFQNIFQVEPGTTVVFELTRYEIIENKRYWGLPSKKIFSTKAIKKEFSRLLKKAVRRRVQGDFYHSAVYLSGGLDSASIAYLLKEQKRNPIAFSVTFKDKEFDESQYQKEISNSLKIPLFSVVGDELFNSNLFQTIWHTEHPLVRTAP